MVRPITRRLKIDLAFGAALLLLGTAALLSFLNIRELRSTQTWVVHTERVLRGVEALGTDLRDAETAQRGYLLTRQESFLDPYLTAPASVEAELEALRSLLADDPEQNRRLQSLRVLAQRRLALLDRTIALARGGNFEEAATIVRLGEGQQIMNSIRTLTRRMVEEEFASLQDHRAREAALAERTIVLVLLWSILAVLVVAASRRSIITELRAREKAERALALREERYRVLVESAGDLIFTTDAEGCFTYANPSATRVLGYSPECLLGMHALDLVRPDMRQEMRRRLERQRLHQQSTVYYEVPIVGRDGREVWLGQNVQLLQTGRQIVGMQVVARDITRQVEVERLKDEFLSVVSHELRTPLTSLRGSLGLLASGKMGALDDRGRRMLDIAEQNTDRLVRLINDLLDIEKIESGVAPMQKEPVALSPLIHRAVEELQPLAQKVGVTMIVDAVEAPLLADPDRILQVLTNLLSNAVKFSDPGDAVRISVSVHRKEVQLSVRDEGRGIPSDKLKAIFGRFQQVDSSDSRQKGGTGLGLAIAQSIVQQHDGHIWVQSEWGKGSTFHFTLPLRPGGEAGNSNGREG